MGGKHQESAREPAPAGSLLRPKDQATFAVLLVLGWFLVAAGWLFAGGHRGALIDIDRAGERQWEFRLDPNQADWPELMLLPGVGETLAHRIVDSRRQHGPFRDAQDLLRIKGIGPKTLARMRGYLDFSPPEATAPQK